MTEQVQEIRIDQLRGFKDHPFQVKDNEELQALCDSIREYGVLSPLLARPTEGGYEIISGHRRKAAALHLGLDKPPVLVRDMTKAMRKDQKPSVLEKLKEKQAEIPAKSKADISTRGPVAIFFLIRLN